MKTKMLSKILAVSLTISCFAGLSAQAVSIATQGAATANETYDFNVPTLESEITKVEVLGASGVKDTLDAAEGARKITFNNKVTTVEVYSALSGFNAKMTGTVKNEISFDYKIEGTQNLGIGIMRDLADYSGATNAILLSQTHSGAYGWTGGPFNVKGDADTFMGADWPFSGDSINHQEWHKMRIVFTEGSLTEVYIDDVLEGSFSTWFDVDDLMFFVYQEVTDASPMALYIDNLTVKATNDDVWTTTLSEDYGEAMTSEISDIGGGLGFVDSFDATAGVRKLKFNNKTTVNTQNVWHSLSGFKAKMTGTAANEISFKYKIEGTQNVAIALQDIWQNYASGSTAILLSQTNNSFRTGQHNLANNTDYGNFLTYAPLYADDPKDIDHTKWQEMKIVVNADGSTAVTINGLTKTLAATVLNAANMDVLLFNTPDAITAESPLTFYIDDLKVRATDDGAVWTTTLSEDYGENQELTTEFTKVGTDGTGFTDSFVAESESDYARKLTFNNKAAAGNIFHALSGFDAKMTGATKNILSFDYKIEGTQDLALVLMSDWTAYGGGNNAVLLSQTCQSARMYYGGPWTTANNDLGNYLVTQAVYDPTIVIDHTQWHNLKLVFTENGATEAYIDNTLVGSIATWVNVDDISFWCNQEISDASPLSIYIDNIEITPINEGVTLVNADNESVASFADSDTLYAALTVDNTSGAEPASVQVSLVAYDNEGRMINAVVEDVDVAAGASVTLTAADNVSISTKGAKTVKAFVWSGWEALTPLAGGDVATLAQ